MALFLQFTGRRSQHLRLACRTPLKPDPAHRGPLPILPAPHSHPPHHYSPSSRSWLVFPLNSPFYSPKISQVVLGLLDSVQGALLWILMEPRGDSPVLLEGVRIAETHLASCSPPPLPAPQSRGACLRGELGKEGIAPRSQMRLGPLLPAAVVRTPLGGCHSTICV